MHVDDCEAGPTRTRARTITVGGTEGNSRLTGITAVVLLLLLVVESLTLVSLQSFLSWHIFVGLLLVPVVGLKLASTGYRFVRFYAGEHAYVAAGPPPIVLRLLAPVLAFATASLFATGTALALLGPGRSVLLPLHKASFVVWIAAVPVHALAHIVRIPGLTTPDLRGGDGLGGSRLRLGLVSGAVVAGAVAAVAALPLIPPWTHWLAGAR